MTSEAVLTDLFHLLDPGPHYMQSAWTLVRSGSMILASIDDAELPEIHALMAQYADRPMDFADATLVHLAYREGISTILTTDHSDFETYRIGGRRRFRILPARRP
jgi:predicted nucleic acid-binding protein